MMMAVVRVIVVVIRTNIDADDKILMMITIKGPRRDTSLRFNVLIQEDS